LNEGSRRARHTGPQRTTSPPELQWVAFISNVDDLGVARSIYTVRTDGTHLRRLTTTGDLHPRFAPATR
jgi:hypothetical protein